MKKVILDANARFKLERLCDALHPQEIGGVLFGSQESEVIWVTDIFPIANISENKNTTFKEHPWGDYWRDLYGYANKCKWLGTFHSHPNGTIPSEQDMRAYNDSNLHLWVIHHSRGEHTFQTSIGLNHCQLELAPVPVREATQLELTEQGCKLGDITIDEHGRLQMDNISAKILQLDEKHRVTFLAILKLKDKSDEFYITELIKKLNIGKPTVRNRLRKLEKMKIVRHSYKDRWRLEKT